MEYLSLSLSHSYPDGFGDYWALLQENKNNVSKNWRTKKIKIKFIFAPTITSDELN